MSQAEFGRELTALGDMEILGDSVQARLKAGAESRDTKATLSTRPLKPVAGLDAGALLGMSETSYLEFVQWTRQVKGTTNLVPLNVSSPY